jgi:hypothetical protein
MEEERRSGWRSVAARVTGPAGLLAALLSLLLAPLAGASCGPDNGGPVHLCYTGGQVVTRTPELDTSAISGPDDFRDVLLHQVTLSGGPAVVALIAMILLGLGVLAVAIPRPAARAAVVATTALGGVALVVTTHVLVINGLTDTAGELPSLFATIGRPRSGAVTTSDFVGTEWGFWVVLAVLLLVTVAAGGSWVRARRDAWARELRRLDGN